MSKPASKSTNRRGRLPKYQVLKLRLLQEMQEMAPGAALPTVAALRRTHGISQATVDRALGELRTEGLIRTRQGSGLYVAPRASVKQVGLTMPYNIFDFRHSETIRLLMCALQRAAAEQRTLLRHYIPPDDSWKLPIDALHLDIRNRQLDGLIVLEEWHTAPMDWGLPVVALEALPSVSNCVITDREALIRLGVQALAEAGCRHLGFVGDRDQSAAQRVVLARSLAAAGLPSEPVWYETASGSDPEHYVEAGRRIAQQRLLGNPLAIDGLLCLDDYATSGMLEIAPNLPGVLIASQTNRQSPVLADFAQIRLEFDQDEIAETLLALLARLADGTAAPGERLWIRPALA